MSKTRKERRAEAVEALRKEVAENENDFDILETIIINTCGINYYKTEISQDAEALIDLLSEDTCTRIPHPKRTFGPFYTCSVCGYGVGDDRWTYCPKCGSLIDRSKHGQD